MYILQIFIKIADFCCFFHFFRVFKVFLAGGGERGESVVFFQVAHVDRKLFVLYQVLFDVTQKNLLSVYLVV